MIVKQSIKGLVFDVYGTLVNVDPLAEIWKVIPNRRAVHALWRAKQLEYSFLRSLMGKYQDFWMVSEQALDYTIQQLRLNLTAEQRTQLIETWLHPTAYPEAVAALPALAKRYRLAVLSNGSPKMLETGLTGTGLRPYFRWVLSAHTIRRYKPSPEVYRLALKRMKLKKAEILFVSSNAWDVIGAKSFGFTVCWIKRTNHPLDPLGPKPDLIVKNCAELEIAML